MFKSIKEKVNTRLGKEPTETDNENKEAEHTEEDINDDKDTVKEERGLIVLIEKSRSIYQKKGLVGSVEISRTFAALTRTVSCDIDGSQELTTENSTDENDEKDENHSRIQKMAIAAIERCVKTLEARAAAYRHKSYKDDLSITSTVYVSGPLLGLVAVSVSCSATVATLNQSSDLGK